ncbi:MAG: tRNA (adenosine(37)-N6)-dimethylallyltransferase MiaA [Pseudomonadales bacterium]|nr:tRNA (adenosine(37)-N6)-dimethylallyltransferase MiaA [Pseudomonadales bacterium]
MGMLPPAICLMGPTASGKSDLALELARDWPLEIVNVDSAQVYRGMDIGTAKPDAATRAAVPHHLIDIRDPADTYSAADFRADVLPVMDGITERGRIPLLTGGTMLYFKALKEGLAGMPPADPAIRDRISALAGERGWPAVHARLSEVDPEAAARINPNDPQRLQRALEVYELTGKPMTAHHDTEHQPCRYDLIEIAIVPEDRAALHQRIGERFDRMLARGLVEEVRALHARMDLSGELPSMKAVGYRQIWQFLDGIIDAQTMRDRAVAATRQLAKRQFTWLRSWQDLQKIDRPHVDKVLKLLQSRRILTDF